MSEESDFQIKQKYFSLSKEFNIFLRDIGDKNYSTYTEKLMRLKEQCKAHITKQECLDCFRELGRLCLTKLFAFCRGKSVLSHCGEELSDCYWISENEGYALVLKATDLNTKPVYSGAFQQIVALGKIDSIKVIFFANNHPTSNQFLDDSLNYCITKIKHFIVVELSDLIQILYNYENTHEFSDFINSIQNELENGENTIAINHLKTSLNFYSVYLEDLVKNHEISRIKQHFSSLISLNNRLILNNKDFNHLDDYFSILADFLINPLKHQEDKVDYHLLHLLLNLFYQFLEIINEKFQGTNWEIPDNFRDLTNILLYPPEHQLFSLYYSNLIGLPKQFPQIANEPKFEKDICSCLMKSLEIMINVFNVRSFERLWSGFLYNYLEYFFKNHLEIVWQNRQLEDEVFEELTPYFLTNSVFQMLDDTYSTFMKKTINLKVDYRKIIAEFNDLFFLYFKSLPNQFINTLEFSNFLYFVTIPFNFPEIFWNNQHLDAIRRMLNNFQDFLLIAKDNKYIHKMALIHYASPHFYRYLETKLERISDCLIQLYKTEPELYSTLFKSYLNLLNIIHKFWILYANEFPHEQIIDDDDLLLDSILNALLKSRDLMEKHLNDALNYIQTIIELYFRNENRNFFDREQAKNNIANEITENLIFFISNDVPNQRANEVQVFLNDFVNRLDESQRLMVLDHLKKRLKEGVMLHLKVYDIPIITPNGFKISGDERLKINDKLKKNLEKFILENTI